MKTIESLEGCKHCPVCHQAPSVTMSESETTVIECAEHGHMAMGADLEQAVEHWNRYVDFVSKGA